MSAIDRKNQRLIASLAYLYEFLRDKTMTAAISQPSGITTAEQQLLWIASGLNEAAPTQTLLESIGNPNYQIQLLYGKNPQGKRIVVIRSVLELFENSEVSGTPKPWMFAKSIDMATAIPAYYSSN